MQKESQERKQRIKGTGRYRAKMHDCRERTNIRRKAENQKSKSRKNKTWRSKEAEKQRSKQNIRKAETGKTQIKNREKQNIAKKR